MFNLKFQLLRRIGQRDLIRADYHGGKKFEYRVQPPSVTSPRDLSIECNVQGPDLISAFVKVVISTECSGELLEGQKSTAPIFATIVEELCKG
jgi:hypothetical protein